jgi:hypothetical protein
MPAQRVPDPPAQAHGGRHQGRRRFDHLGGEEFEDRFQAVTACHRETEGRDQAGLLGQGRPRE